MNGEFISALEVSLHHIVENNANGYIDNNLKVTPIKKRVGLLT